MAKGLLHCSEPFPLPWLPERTWGKLLHPGRWALGERWELGQRKGLVSG